MVILAWDMTQVASAACQEGQSEGAAGSLVSRGSKALGGPHTLIQFSNTG